MSTGSTATYSFPYPLSTDPVRVSSDIEELSVFLDENIKEIIEDLSSSMWTGGSFLNGINTPSYNDTTGKMTLSLSQDLASSASPQFSSLSLSGNLLSASQPTFDLINTSVSTLNFAGAATTINFGSTSGTLNIKNNTVSLSGDITLASSKEFKINNVSVLSSTALGSSVVSSSLTSVGTITSGTWQGTTISTDKGGTGLTSFTANRAIYSTSSSQLSSGILPLEAGGTNSSITAINGGIVYSTASGMSVTLAGSSGQVLMSNGTSAPSWTALPGATTITISGDATGSGTSTINVTLADTGVSSGTYGSEYVVPKITVDSKGRITSVVQSNIDPMPQIFMMAGM